MPKKNNRALGAEVRALLEKGIKGIDRLQADLRKKVAKTKTKGRSGYIKGLDGRRVYIRSDHSALNFLLQGGGAIVMKMALVVFHFELVPAAGWVHDKDFAYCANVHDEVQIECRPEIAEDLGEAFKDAIRIAGERLNIRCPLAGTSSHAGANWKETH